MNIWINKVEGDRISGLAVVAARNNFEAHGILTKTDNWYNSYFKFENWKCIAEANVMSNTPYMVSVVCRKS